MFTATLCLDLLLGDIRSLKQKRAIVRPIVAEIQRRFGVSVAEVGHRDLYRRAEIGVAVVAGEAAHCGRVLDAVEQMVAARPELDVLAAHRQIFSSADD